jgi:hypothetical protein
LIKELEKVFLLQVSYIITKYIMADMVKKILKIDEGNDVKLKRSVYRKAVV